jgi:glucose/arabinose dehydrogenase
MARVLVWMPFAAALVISLVAGCAGPRPGEDTTAIPSAASSAPASPAGPRPTSSADLRLDLVADGLVAPIGLVTPGGDGDASFVVDQTGPVLMLRDGQLLDDPYLDLSDRLVRLNPEYDERGLLGLAFHPVFAQNGRLFAYYSAPATNADDDHDNVLSEFHADPAGDRADPSSERVILRFGQPQPNHSGGGLGFGPDGRLYLGTGDGGGRGDADAGHAPGGNAQDPTRLLGKVLRVDVDGGADAPYAIPSDNPFVDDSGRPEIFALGFRNPWRLSWEPGGDRRLLVSDVGFGRYEELDVVESGGNYGWRVREGMHCLDLTEPLADLETCPQTDEDRRPLLDPVLEYSHQEVGLAIVGGFVYRGSEMPKLRGRYVFGDWSADWQTEQPLPRGSLLVSDPRPADAGAWAWRRLSLEEPLARFVTGLGEDAAGELYVMTRGLVGPVGLSGAVYRITPAQ